MLGLNRWNPYQDMQREFDRLINQFWTDLPERTASAPATSFRVDPTDDGWRVHVPMPGVDPEHVLLEAAGNTLSIRVQEPGEGTNGARVRFEQTLTVPPFLDIDKVSASHRHGMLQLTLPLRESVKPRRIQIDTADRKQLANSTN